ncbi:tRNA (guanosine(46)-N7)-methyltransferase TrmB [Cellvibrio japonicus]|uniref:tRNA (guanosine(46)-N7)-methyltransferase TrmB n=1 Tax=Cellvibrio japonicus TaxID=155077 RepID=UPI0002F53FEC|nr:tRNA (guanosine(46)-N7)-methyltransferase TrmB [Cellvibrio japonicus]
MSDIPQILPVDDADQQGFLIKPEFKPKSIRSFVIRAGRITEGQKKAFDECWPRIGLSLFAGAINPSLVFSREAPLVLEIGFGMGDSLLAMARNESDKNFIGIEVHPPGVGRLMNLAIQAELSNLRVYMADAMDVLEDCIPNESIDRLQLYFPDPWHKKKHHKRRILQAEFVQKLRPKLKTGGIFHMATDWQPYAEHMLDVMDSAPGFRNTQQTSGYAPRPDYRPVTKFEKRGERLGHGVWDLLFQKIN